MRWCIERADLRIHWRLSTILKSSKKVYEVNVFRYVKVYIFWKCVQYIIHWDKTRILKKFFWTGQNNGYKKCPLFLLRALTHHSFTFNLQLLYDLKHKVRLNETVCGIFHFRFLSVFIKVYIFVQQNSSTLWL